MDERIYRIVMSGPVPMKLAQALATAPERVRFSAHPVYGTRQPMKRHIILALVSFGLTDQQIADYLGRSRDTIRWHVACLLDAYGARNRTHLAALAIRRGDV